jgi:hypothetical protein
MTPRPIFKQALGDDWEKLHPVVRKHYDLTPGHDQEVTMQGTMHEVDHSRIAKIFLLVGRVFGALIPYKGKNIPTTVRNWTALQGGHSMFWHRTFVFPGGRPIVFSSRMIYLSDNEIIEYVRFGMGIRMRLSVIDGALVYESCGYQWDIGGVTIRIPEWLLLGSGLITESGLSDSEFRMDFQMHHPIFGKTFSYTGNFFIQP